MRPWGWMHPRTVLPQEHPTTADIHWSAGFLEGEGTFSKCSSGNGSRMAANQKEAWPLEKLARLFGGTVKCRTYRHGAFHGTKYENLAIKTMFSWEITGSLARGTMMTIYKLLSPRRKEQVRRALNPAARRA